jgi:hypothetical protein
LEFSAELYGGGAGRYIRQLTGLQDWLGLMQDAEVAAARLADLATGEAGLSATTIFVMGGVAEQHRRESRRILRQLPKEVARVGGRVWSDLTAVMEQRRDQALSLVPPARRTLRALPAPPDPTTDITMDHSPAVTALVPTDTESTVGGSEGPA